MLVEEYNALNKENYQGQLDKYFNTVSLQRLKGKGMFCGMDFVTLDKLKPREYYSRLDHSMNLGFTSAKLGYHGLKEQLSALFHDVGTYSFAHVNSFKKGQGLTQENDEMSVRNVLLQDEEILEYLYQDKINIDDVVDCSKYSLIDKPIPCLCLDRADGILSTCLIWAKTHSFDEIRNLYYMEAYVNNLNGMCFDVRSERLMDANTNGEMFLIENPDVVCYEDYFKSINVYSSILLSKESRYFMEVFGMILNYYQDLGLFSDSDLFYLSEQEIVDRILDSKYKSVWIDFINMSEIKYASNDDNGLVIVSHPKIRQSNPLVWGQMNLCEINDISGDFYRELNNLSDDIEDTYKPIVGNLSNSTVKILSKYKRK